MMMKYRKLLVCMGLMLASLSVQAQSVAFDDGLERSTPEAQGVKSETVADLFKAIDEKGYEVHSLMIIRHNKVIAEHWWYPYAAEYRHAMYSSTKTFTGIAIGFAVQEGLLNIDDKVTTFFPDLLPKVISPELESLTVKHLLTMSVGHASTSYAGSGDSQVRSFLAADFAHRPGEAFAYNITASHMLSNIITRVTGLTVHEYLKPRLMDPIGMDEVIWEMDVDGRNMGNGGMHSKTSDMAKFGMFLNAKGAWNGKQLLDSKWIEAATSAQIFQRPDRSAEENEKDDGGKGYGYQLWLGRHGSFRAIGASNQLIMVIPEYDLVVVSTGSVGDEAGFNSLIYDMLPEMSDKKLNVDKSFDLNGQLAGYKLKTPYDAPETDIKVCSSTRRYNMLENSYGIKAVAFRFDAAGNCYLTIEANGSISNIPFGLNDWKIGQTDRTMLFARAVYTNTMGVTPVRTAGYCTWSGIDELSACYLSMFNVGASERFRFTFDGDRLTMEVVAPAQTRNAAPQRAANNNVTLTGIKADSNARTTL